MSFWRDLWALLLAWWSDDRVRVSPNAGRLLRLRVDAIIKVDGEPMRVTHRNMVSDEHGSWVAYRCEGVEQNSEIWVAPAGHGAVVIRRVDLHGGFALAPERVEIFG